MLEKSLGMIIAAGGSGSRYSRSKNKLMVIYKDKPLLVHTLEKFLPVVTPGCLVVAAPQHQLVAMRKTVDSFLPDNNIKWTFGGPTRLASVANAAFMLPEELDLVAIHDGARPLASVELLRKLCRAAIETGGAVPGMIPTNTIKSIDSQGLIKENLVRSELAEVATPQVFRFLRYKNALDQLSDELLSGAEESPVFTDDAAIFTHAGYQVKVVFSKEPNPKITRPEDLDFLNSLEV